ncbi:hypothetical protein LTR99_008579 [Exophiala xenobiotica]|uniref:Pyridoxamine 5'-phosphate oxidase Alr4036 family FMN-binding domain-containing protein n=1 Tax=Vermiconidia calcicola TaxID=1690605 RepID=A0AAV9Q361_9PEZI|nr:hypothetical protein LTR92_008274 [Exophiala xenobiotica]KAK5532968.1 hypothetical protein LTR25_007673 [Vermiconidia calcicola]KAK5546698.1 hypothetical protein LTR23_003446 [Chaetothyriales sp. CCFEE 6169]KAK5269958.1 hypothetical protein LTR96_004457 [Exophiala xenobiotica]KAK5296937.1 hypothetical protein LTR99_008579 [Exophiala xenobiotica]
MASASLATTAVAALDSTQKRQFTIILTTPRRPTPTFLHQVQQSSLTPLFIGADGIFFRRTRLSDWGWSHIFLFAGKDVKFDPSFELRQVWSFTVEADEDLANDENFAVEEQRAQYGTLKASGSEVEDPKDLSALLKCWIRPRSNRLRVLHFLNFTGSDTQGWYKEHLVEKDGECGLKVHLFGKVTHMSKVEDRWHETNVEDAEKTEAFGLLSFPGEREYAGFLVSDEHRRLVRGADKNGEEVRKEGVGIVEEGMILTKEMRLPPKDQVINRYGWQYGNPYEPFGEDFFG